MSELESSYNTVTNSNAGYNSSSALQLRLDSSVILENIELFLRGSKVVIQEDAEGRIVTRNIPLGTAKCNDAGIQSILNFISSIINPQVVQGNFTCDAQGHSSMYEAYIEETHTDLATQLLINSYNWGLRDEDIPVICDFVMKLVIPFVTRLIDNKERESYDQTVKHIESSSMREGRSGFNLFGGGKNG